MWFCVEFERISSNVLIPHQVIKNMALHKYENLCYISQSLLLRIAKTIKWPKVQSDRSTRSERGIFDSERCWNGRIRKKSHSDRSTQSRYDISVIERKWRKVRVTKNFPTKDVCFSKGRFNLNIARCLRRWTGSAVKISWRNLQMILSRGLPKYTIIV